MNCNSNYSREPYIVRSLTTPPVRGYANGGRGNVVISKSEAARVVSAVVHQQNYPQPTRYHSTPTREVTIVQGSATNVTVVKQNSYISGVKPLPVTTQTGDVLFPVARSRRI